MKISMFKPFNFLRSSRGKNKIVLFENNHALVIVANNIDDMFTYQVLLACRSAAKFSQSVIRDVTILKSLDSDDLRRRFVG